MSDASSSAPTSDQIRHSIDRGHGGDKVAAVDPAAAPLGTDEEAAGTPATAEERRQAAAAEVRPAAASKSEGGRDHNPRGSGKGILMGVVLGAGAAVVLGVVLSAVVG